MVHVRTLIPRLEALPQADTGNPTIPTLLDQNQKG